jgi:hypothetical protein
MNEAAATVSIGSDGLFILPFGNGAGACWKINYRSTCSNSI